MSTRRRLRRRCGRSEREKEKKLVFFGVRKGFENVLEKKEKR